jgi:glutamate 5-kinase
MKRNTSQTFLKRGSTPIVVIKVGTSSLIRPEKHTLNLSSLAGIVEVIRSLRDEGYNVVLVSSGAVGIGCQRLGLNVRPTEVSKKQALAAVGQVHLMRFYEDLFSAMGMTCAQVLLTQENLSNRSQYINAKNTFQELLSYGAVPVVNENDTVAVEQLRIGDNDTLSAQVATLIGADWLFLMTDVNALYTSNPNSDPNAQPIHSVPSLSKLAVDTSMKGTQWGTGGMATKLTAARMATAAGCRMVICHYSEPRNVLKIINGEEIGTIFHPLNNPISGRKRWILGVPVRGSLWLDDGAVKAVRDRKKSLFTAGIYKTGGDFGAQDAVSLCDSNGAEFARGLVNYDKDEVDLGKGLSSKDFIDKLGFVGQEEVVSRTNICLLLEKVDEDDEEGDEEGAGLVGAGKNKKKKATLIGGSVTPPGHQDTPATSPIRPTNSKSSISNGPSIEDEIRNMAYLRRSMTPGPAHDGATTDDDDEDSRYDQPDLRAAGGSDTVDVAARLAVLQNRLAAGGLAAAMGGNGAGRREGGDEDVRVCWEEDMAAAVKSEIEEAMGNATIVDHGNNNNNNNNDSSEDINQEGWLPK